MPPVDTELFRRWLEEAEVEKRLGSSHNAVSPGTDEAGGSDAARP